MHCKPFKSLVLAVTLAALTAAPIEAAAQNSLKELRARQDEERALSRQAAYTNKICGSSISARIDWGRSSGWPANESLAQACDGALGAIEAMCRAGEADAVASGISSLTCSGDGSGPSLRGSSLSYGASPGSNGFRETRDYLERAF